ncbi:restriction endonuclease subunit S [Winogradskyella tangerina]|uniref:restriction endonuclease subunit S n=1 Tax=Winogradskyella tangerina TaxID=2023240 RepID=UPI000DBE3489|nr:restriction endonuclease subunit S [Winogradskyella tangerina]
MIDKWDKVKLGAVAPYRTLKIDSVELNAFNFISADNMEVDRGGITSSVYAPKKGRATLFEKDDILVSNIRPYFKKIWQAKFRGGCSNDVFVLRTNGNKADSKFIYYYLSKQDFFDFMMAGANGTKMPRGNKKAIPNYKINLPPLPTQRKIASILSAYDDLIENNLKRIKLLEEKAQNTYEEWFVRMKFPGHETTPINKETGLPEGWEKVYLKDLCLKITKGTTPTSLKRQFIKQGVNYIKAESYTDSGSFIHNKFAYIDDETHELLKRSKLEEMDVIVSIAGVLGRVALVSRNELPANTNQAVGIVRLDQTLISPFYIRYFLASAYMNKLINTISGQAAQPNINLTQLGLFKVALPTADIVQKFHDLIINSFETQLVLFKQNQLLKEARDIFLPRLMTGMIDLEALDVKTAEVNG